MTGIRDQGSGIRNDDDALNKLATVGAVGGTVLLAGCRQDMQDQPKFFPQRGTTFYRGWPLGASAGGEHGGARSVA